MQLWLFTKDKNLCLNKELHKRIIIIFALENQ